MIPPAQHDAVGTRRTAITGRKLTGNLVTGVVITGVIALVIGTEQPFPTMVLYAVFVAAGLLQALAIARSICRQRR